MTAHNLYYYPYASFTDKQLPLLKVAACYFDKLFVLDPLGATSGSVGADAESLAAVDALKGAGILEIIRPSEVLATYSDAMAAAIRRDMADPAFLELCEAHSRATGKERWLLSLAKVQQGSEPDQKMRHILGDFAREMAAKSRYARSDYIERVVAKSGRSVNELPKDVFARAHHYREYAETGQVYDEHSPIGAPGGIEYRYAEFPLALGEAIMLNHALFGGLFHAGATPIADDAFHSDALAVKLHTAAKRPEVQASQERRRSAQGIKADLLAATALRDRQLDLPVIRAEISLDEILEYRHSNPGALAAARDKFGWLARAMESEPWTDDFADELDRKTIPALNTTLAEVQRARDAWLGSQRGRTALKLAGVVAGAATVALSLVAAPLTPIALATAGLGLATGVAIPGGEWLFDWRDGKKSVQENGLHYLLRV